MPPKPELTSPFVFAICQAGAEKALKAEIAREHPELRFAFSRPGFVTFKAPGEAGPAERLHSVLARAWGLSHSKLAPSPGRAAEVARLAREWGARRLHVFERHGYVPGDEPPGARPWGDAAREARAVILAAAPASLEADESARGRELVMDVVVIEPDQAECEWWIGAHVHGPERSPHPGARLVREIPADAPSRAWLKLEEALDWSGAPIKKGDVAIEVGSAPGGASLALLDRGLLVTGIDTGAMAPVVGKHPRYRHVHKGVQTATERDLPRDARWLVVDMNIAPWTSLGQVKRVAEMIGGSLAGVLLTIKLNEWRYAAEIPNYLEAVRQLGPGLSVVRAVQLSSNRREICIYGRR